MTDCPSSSSLRTSPPALPGNHSVSLWLRVQLFQRLVGRLLARLKLLNCTTGRSARTQRACSRLGRAAAALLLSASLLLHGAARAYAAGPAFVEQTDANPFNGVGLPGSSAPTFADLDGDGDLDAVVGEMNALHYFKNTGTPLVPIYTEQIDDFNPFNGVVGKSLTPALVDIDRDGDLDAFIGNKDGNILYFKNTGTPLAPVFTAQTDAANPFNGVSVVKYSAPALADLDGDGDMDALIGAEDGLLYYYKNTGTPLVPIFTAQIDADNPFNAADVGGNSNPTLADLDGDGDLDALVGEMDDLHYFKNTGTPLAPVFARQTGAADPFNSVTVGSGSAPAFADVDGDGDLDAFSGAVDGSIHYYQNTGANTILTPAFVLRSGAADPFNGLFLDYGTAPALADLDGDGDQDVVIGMLNGTFYYYQNIGTPALPVYTQLTGTANPFNGLDVGDNSAPALADLDNDGDLDFIGGNNGGTLNYYKNTGTPLVPVFTAQTGAANPLNGVDVGDKSAPTLGDLDGDGDLDLVIGNSSGTLSYYKNTGVPAAPAFTAQSGTANPFNGFVLSNYSMPVLADLDADGDLDVLSGENTGTFKYYRNTGTPLVPAFTEQTGTANPFNGVDVGYRSAPVFADVDGDGDLDALSGEDDGYITYFKNTGTPLLPVYTEQAGAANPFNPMQVSQHSTPTFADLDGDGDLDAIVGEEIGSLRTLKNTGTPLSPVFTKQTGADNPFNNVGVGGWSRPTFVDIDRDGDLELFIGNKDGVIAYYQNTGTPLAPAFTEQTGTANPFNGVDVGENSTPAFVDVDGDGDQDAFSGESNGAILYFQNTGTPLVPLFTTQTGAANPFNGVDMGNTATPVFADVDGDGDQDAFIGALNGTTKYYRNTGTPLSPLFTLQTGVANPLNAVAGKNFTAPAFADIDGDGDLDFWVGSEQNGIRYYENTHCSFASESDTAIAAGDVLQFGVGNSALFVKVNTLGSLTSLSAACTPNSQPNATSSGLQSSVYWTLTPNTGASGFDLDLTLPFKNPDINNKVCRYDTTASAWSCLQSSHTATDLTRAHVTALSDWTVGSNVGPTAVDLSRLSAIPQTGFGAVALGLLGGLGALLTAWLRRKK